MLKRSLATIAYILFILPALALAQGVATGVKGTSLVKKIGEDWHILKEGEALQDGTTIWIGASSSFLLRVGDNLAELTGSPDGQDVTITKLLPLEVQGKIEIRYIGPPAPPTPQSPAAGFKSRDGNVELSWSPSVKEALYHFQIAARPDFNKVIVDEKSYNTAKRLERLETGMFYWRVSAVNKEGVEGKFSEVRSFEVKPLPDPPSLSPPASTKTSTTFRWKRGGDDEKYHLQISKNKGFSETTVDMKEIEGPRVTVGMLEEGDYLVRVSAIDEDGFEGRFSEPQSFYVGPKVPSSSIAPLMIMFGVAFMLLGL